MRYAPIAEHLYSPTQPGPSDFTPTWLVGELLGAWRHMMAPASGLAEIWAYEGTVALEDFGGDWQLRTAT
eukprot:8348792-Pyramimonas_sp.AAC.1